MAARRPLLLSIAFAGLLAMGCGASVAQSQSAAQSQAAAQSGGAAATSSSSTAVTAPEAASSEATGRAGGVAAVTRARVDQSAATVIVDVTVTGPAELLGGCQPTLAVHLVDAAGNRLAEPTPPGTVHCLAIVDVPLGAGETRDFTTSTRLPAAHGTYRVEGQLNGAGPIPAVTITV